MRKKRVLELLKTVGPAVLVGLAGGIGKALGLALVAYLLR